MERLCHPSAQASSRLSRFPSAFAARAMVRSVTDSFFGSSKRDPNSGATILSGTVTRIEVMNPRAPSSGMRLKHWASLIVFRIGASSRLDQAIRGPVIDLQVEPRELSGVSNGVGDRMHGLGLGVT